MNQERNLALLLALVLLAGSGYASHAAWQAYGQRVAMSQRLDAVKIAVAPLIEARDHALALSAQSAELLKPLMAPRPLEVMAHLDKVLPKGSVVKELDLSEQDLRVALELPTEVSRSKVVSDLESGGWFGKVSEVKDGMARTWVSYHMKLSGPRPPGYANMDAGLTRGAAALQAGSSAAPTLAERRNAP